MRRPHAAIFFLLLLMNPSAQGATAQITEDFNTASAASGTTGVWNVSTGTLHVPFVVDRSGGTVAGQEDEAILIGDGSDGPFNATTMVNFDTNAGGVAGTVTLDTSRIYQFTDFTLPNGTTLLGSGTDPLRIRAQGSVEIEGTIDLNGGDGGNSITPPANVNNGGTTCCGGGAGGAGPSAVQSFPVDGTSPAISTLGWGQAGTISTLGGTDGGAGGGGGNRYAGTVGAANLVASGAGGSAYADETLETLVGGAGGGGGAGNTAVLAAVGSGGPGGGGGGGTLSIQAGNTFRVAATGQILAKGGNGGDSNPAHGAGGGGGGGGGSILIYAGATGVDNGSIDATGGLGGQVTAAVPGGDGGGGVIRFAFSSGEFTGTGTENPPPSIVPKPKTVYSKASYVIVSPNYDTQASNPHYSALVKDQTLHSGDTITYQVAGSNDNFVADDTGYLPEGDLGRLDGKRYFRFKVTLQSGNTSTSPEVRQLSIQFKNLFEFSLVGCARAVPPSGGRATPWGWAILVSYLVAFSVWWRRSRAKR